MFCIDEALAMGVSVERLLTLLEQYIIEMIEKKLKNDRELHTKRGDMTSSLQVRWVGIKFFVSFNFIVEKLGEW